MISRPIVSHWHHSTVQRYDILLCAAGYETRARFVAEAHHGMADRRIAIGFDYHHVHALADNMAWFDEHGFLDWARSSATDSVLLNDQQFPQVVDSLLRDEMLFKGGASPRYAVDISSFSSLRLATIVEVFSKVAEKREIAVDFLYAPGCGYSETSDAVQIEFAEPVTPWFAGWSAEPESPVIAIFGLGLEYERSIGVFELLNPASVYAFATTGASAALDKKITEANKLLYPLVAPSRRFAFSVERPKDCYNSMRSVASGALRDGRPVFIPLGPKVFTLCSLLIAAEYFPRIGVWRISTGRHGTPQDISPRGNISGLTVRFGLASRIASAQM